MKCITVIGCLFLKDFTVNHNITEMVEGRSLYNHIILQVSRFRCRCHHTKSNPIDDQGNISSKKLQKQNFKPLGHYTCMQCGTPHLQTVQENILSRIILSTNRKFTGGIAPNQVIARSELEVHEIYKE